MRLHPCSALEPGSSRYGGKGRDGGRDVSQEVKARWVVEMGVSKNRGTPKWMVKKMENPIKMDDLGVPLFSETPKCFLFSPRIPGEMIQFDEHLFSDGLTPPTRKGFLCKW